MLNKDIRDLFVLSKRHSKLYFKDKSAFLPSLITPVILVVLFLTFLKSVYESTILQFIPEGVEVSSSVISSFSGSWLFSSIIGVSCVTIAFCANLIMPLDKANKNANDFYVTPVKRNVLSFSYLLSNLFSTLIVVYTCVVFGFIYIAIVGWYFSFIDVLLIILVVFISCLFGCALASVAEYFISSQGGVSAISALVSSMYGFICGAYMPLSQFSVGIRNVISFLPGTYTIGLLRNFYMRGVINELSNKLPEENIKILKDSFDANIYFFGNQVQIWQMFLYVGLTIAVLFGAYFLFVMLGKKRCSEKLKKEAIVK